MGGDGWAKLLVGGVILTALGFLAVEVHNNGKLLETIVTKQDGTTKRVDRIALALPGLGIRIAKEELSKPINLAIISTQLTKNTKGKYEHYIVVLDSIKRKEYRYKTILNEPDPLELKCKTAGSARYLCEDFVSFKEMVEFAATVDSRRVIPGNIDLEASFLLRNTNGEYEKYLKKFGGKPKIKYLRQNVNTWDSLIDKIQKNHLFKDQR